MMDSWPKKILTFDEFYLIETRDAFAILTVNFLTKWKTPITVYAQQSNAVFKLLNYRMYW